MIIHMYTIKDTKSTAYHKPFYEVSNGIAIRTFTDLANNKDTVIGKHPEDFILYHIGEYDDETGKIKQEGHKDLGRASAYINN